MDGREARESGLWLNASAARIVVPEQRVNPKKRLGHRGEGRLKRRPAHETRKLAAPSTTFSYR
jgi:hypothetical protein